MEDPLLNKTEHNVDVTINGNSSSNDEHIVDITTDDRSLSSDEQTPHEAEGVQSCDPCTEENVMNLIEFILTLVQIVAAIVVVTRAKDKHPEATLFIWIIGYTCACIASLPFLCCQLWHYSVTLDTRSPIVFFKKMLEFFFVGWFVAFFWISFVNSSPVDHTTLLFWLCVAFLAFSFIRYVVDNLKCTALCVAILLWTWLDAVQEGISPNIMLVVASFATVLGLLDHMYGQRG